MLWTVHKLTKGRGKEDGFKGWHITLPGHPVEIARSELPQKMPDAQVWRIFSRALGGLPKKCAITKLFEQTEEVAGYMLLERGHPIAFLMRLNKAN